MSKFVYFSAEEGQIVLSVDQVEVGKFSTAKELAEALRPYDPLNADYYASSSIDFADEYGFENYEDAGEIIDQAMTLAMEAA